ncbi:MAG: CcdB family protein [Sphingomonas phyllosphaerae]
MAKFDVYPSPEGGYWLDCQSDTLSMLNSRFVVPLADREHDLAFADRRLNPEFEIAGEKVVMLTHFAAAIPASLLRSPIASLIDQEYAVGIALDMLISGF